MDLIIIYFLIYSVIGWMCEVVYCSFLSKKFVNRGFLAGPVCPVYGFGALFVIWLLKPVEANVVIVFMCGFVITSVLEYITGWFLEAVFHTQWWNYDDQRFNLNGRVCLKNSVMFGVMSVILMKVLHPFIVYSVGLLPMLWTRITAITLVAVLSVDLVFTINTLTNLHDRLRKLNEFAEFLKQHADFQEWFNEHELFKSFDRLKALAEEGRYELNQKLREKFEGLADRKGSGMRLIKAFPGMRSTKYDLQLSNLKEVLKQLKQKTGKRNEDQ